MVDPQSNTLDPEGRRLFICALPLIAGGLIQAVPNPGAWPTVGFGVIGLAGTAFLLIRDAVLRVRREHSPDAPRAKASTLNHMTPIERFARAFAAWLKPRCQECGAPVGKDESFCSDEHAEAYNDTHAW